jgi:NAD(P) transhydrogenase
LAAAFARSGIRLELGQGRASVERRAGELTVALADGETLRPERVLFAAGRAGNTDGLGLAEAGVEVDERGRIIVDERYRTSAEGIYAAGDVIGHPSLASVSMEQARVAICHTFGIPFKETIDPVAPYGVYAIPEVGMVGMTEEDAAAAGIDHEVGRAGSSRTRGRASPEPRTAG